MNVLPISNNNPIKNISGGKHSSTKTGDIFRDCQNTFNNMRIEQEKRARELQQRLQDRVNNQAKLSNLLQECNINEKEVDWSQNAEVRELIDHARDLGVKMPVNGYKFTHDQLKTLKDNINLVRESDNITKIDQLKLTEIMQNINHAYEMMIELMKMGNDLKRKIAAAIGGR